MRPAGRRVHLVRARHQRPGDRDHGRAARARRGGGADGGHHAAGPVPGPPDQRIAGRHVELIHVEVPCEGGTRWERAGVSCRCVPIISDAQRGAKQAFVAARGEHPQRLFGNSRTLTQRRRDAEKAQRIACISFVIALRISVSLHLCVKMGYFQTNSPMRAAAPGSLRPDPRAAARSPARPTRVSGSGQKPPYAKGSCGYRLSGYLIVLYDVFHVSAAKFLLPFLGCSQDKEYTYHIRLIHQFRLM